MICEAVAGTGSFLSSDLASLQRAEQAFRQAYLPLRVPPSWTIYGRRSTPAWTS